MRLNVQMAKRFLDILRVHENASGDEIRWGAKKRIMEVLEAYEVLCGNKRRKNHDKHGEEGFQSRVTGGGGGRGSGFTCPKETFAEIFGPNNPFEIFNMDRPGQKASEKPSHENVDDLLDSFGFRGSRVGDGDSISRRSSSMGNPPIEHDLYVTLEELQEGCEKKMMITRKMTGIDGKTKQESKLLIVNIKPGCKSGTRITFEGEGDRGSRGNPTDVALYGTRVDVPTLSGEKMRMDFTDVIIKRNTTRRIPGRGLPIPEDPSRRGDLVIAFEIEVLNHVQKAFEEIVKDPPAKENK
ncbi:unnamed protein product [Darwinula stevensoni]|uniref:Chaperone DnaJ C-terminal domain-containing protein n=1 Tax=Darwinula stevensoni TaxID=69355 RepID=A0A7R8X645_9CRUS|nr:unnamed protein product [Darwinula stevensoni]CAG0887763.1 unnamed protein product [Darwinula stevensoni]